MDRAETLAIMTVLKTAYPGYYRDMKPREAENVVNLWAEMFRDEPAGLVAAAVKAHIAQDRKGFPPHIGAIKDAIVRLTAPPESGMSELEAWNLVRRAIRGASMDECTRTMRDGVLGPPSAVEQFEALPEILRRLVGSPRQLADWELLPNDEIDTIIQSNFMRSYRARAEKERELLALPADVQQTMEQIAAGKVLPALDGSVR